MHNHPFDTALQLQETAPGRYSGQTSPAYWNMVGPFGGVTAAMALQAILKHPDLLGEPLSLTVNYAAPLRAGALEVHVRPVRTNRSTQHWSAEILQTDADGELQLATSASAVSALRRHTWQASDAPMPDVPVPEAQPRMPQRTDVAWLQHYEMRPIVGKLPQHWDGAGDGSLSQLWLRDAPARALDFCALTAMADVFFPRVWLRRARHVPAGTVSMTVYFHADAQQLAAVGAGYLLAQARAQAFRHGFFDQAAQLWSADGTLLASSHQIVYYKE